MSIVNIQILSNKPCRHIFLVFTFPASSIRALRCKRSFATSRLPYLAATCRGVKPFYKEKREICICSHLYIYTVSIQNNCSNVTYLVWPPDLVWPLWQESEMLRPPAARLPCPAALHVQRCAKACIRLWWRHQGEPCVAVTAGRFPSDPDGTQCVGGFGRPGGWERERERKIESVRKKMIQMFKACLIFY